MSTLLDNLDFFRIAEYFHCEYVGEKETVSIYSVINVSKEALKSSRVMGFFLISLIRK